MSNYFRIKRLNKKEGIQFYCFKFVSDKANEDANIDWKANLSFGAKLFQSKLLNEFSRDPSIINSKANL